MLAAPALCSVPAEAATALPALLFGAVSTGAMDDIRRATDLAYKAVSGIFRHSWLFGASQAGCVLDAWPGLQECQCALLLLDWLPISTQLPVERLGGACACPFLMCALPCSAQAEPIQMFQPPLAPQSTASARAWARCLWAP